MTTSAKIICKSNWNIFGPQSKRTLDEIGSLKETVANPVSPGVLGFSKDIPRYQVPSAEIMMRAVTGQTPTVGTEPVLTSTKIDNLVGRVANTDTIFPVISSAGKIIGDIDHSIVMPPIVPLS